MHDGIVLKLTV